MNYNDFSEYMGREIPFNRKERFFTGTVLPELLFHNGLKIFYKFLQAIEDFPKDINETTSGDNFLFYTEYNLKQAAANNESTFPIASTNETPDIVIETLKPKKVCIIIEAKMFAKVSQKDLTSQIKSQKAVVGSVLKKHLKLHDRDFFYLALVPKKLGILQNDEYKVLNWEMFLEDEFKSIKNSLFYNYLKYAIEHYDGLVSVSKPYEASTVKFKMKGKDIYLLEDENNNLWVGRMGGKKQYIEDATTGFWYKRQYCMNNVKPLKGQKGNWITVKEFKGIIDKDGNGINQ